MTKIISIEGNIGSGKSTFVEFLKKNLNNDKYCFVDEPVNIWQEIKDISGNDIISKFYEDKKKYAFSFQMLAYISRIANLRQTIKDNPNKIIITERCINTDKEVFAKMLYDDGYIEKINLDIYNMWFEEFSKDISVNGIAFIKTNPNICLERINKRNRNGESIDIEYLNKCNTYHNNWLDNCNNVITFDGNISTFDTDSIHGIWVLMFENFIKN